MISIECTTENQRLMLDKIWSMSSLDEFLDWSAELDHSGQETAVLLAQMLKLAIIDHEVDVMMSMPDAEDIIAKLTQD